MSKLTSNQQTILATWQQHTHAEFVLKDANAALGTMTDNPYVFMISSGWRESAERPCMNFTPINFCLTSRRIWN